MWPAIIIIVLAFCVLIAILAKNQFAVLAQKILDERSEKLKKEGEDNLKTLLDPLRRQLDDFVRRMNEVNSEDVKRASALETGIRNLVEQTNAVSAQASDLARAIRSDAQVTGEWGEAQLKRVLELGGLQEGMHYAYQETFASEGSDRRDLRVDVLLKLPDERWMVIDAKTTMAAYVDYVKAEGDEKESVKKRIVASVKAHVDELKAADYRKNLAARTGKRLFGTTLMYIPFDEVYLVAMKAEITLGGERMQLREYAGKSDVVFVNSASLLPIVRLVEELWARDQADKKALAIKTSAEGLVEKFDAFLEGADGFYALGKHLNDAAKCYNAAIGRLASGKGNIVKRLADLGEMGVSASAKLPAPEEVESHRALEKDD